MARNARGAPSGERRLPRNDRRAARQELRFELGEVEAFAADVGPGSFTGVRVGVILAKTFAYLHGTSVFGADSFDLIDPDGIVVLPSKRGEYFIRRLGEPPYRSGELPSETYSGFGAGIDPSTPPDAARFAPLIRRLLPQAALDLVPHYLIEPSISLPKTPYATR